MDGMVNPLKRIQELCEKQYWSCYQLSKAAGITYSTLNIMINEQNMPSIPTLFKLRQGFDITVSDFFEPSRGKQGLTSGQVFCLPFFTTLPQEDKQLALACSKGLSETF